MWFLAVRFTCKLSSFLRFCCWNFVLLCSHLSFVNAFETRWLNFVHRDTYFRVKKVKRTELTWPRMINASEKSLKFDQFRCNVIDISNSSSSPSISPWASIVSLSSVDLIFVNASSWTWWNVRNSNHFRRIHCNDESLCSDILMSLNDVGQVNGLFVIACIISATERRLNRMCSNHNKLSWAEISFHLDEHEMKHAASLHWNMKKTLNRMLNCELIEAISRQTVGCFAHFFFRLHFAFIRTIIVPTCWRAMKRRLARYLPNSKSRERKRNENRLCLTSDHRPPWEILEIKNDDFELEAAKVILPFEEHDVSSIFYSLIIFILLRWLWLLLFFVDMFHLLFYRSSD